MAIGPTIENLRRKRADEAALLEMLYSLPTPTGGFDINTPAERRQLAERGLRGGEPYSDGRMDYGRQRPNQNTIDVMPQQPAEFYAREVSRDILGPRATNDLFGYPQGTGTMVGDMLAGGGLLGLVGAKAPLTAWDAGTAAAQGNYGDAALKSAFSLLEGAGLGELATGARGIKAVASEFPEVAREFGQSARGFLADESGALVLPKADKNRLAPEELQPDKLRALQEALARTRSNLQDVGVDFTMRGEDYFSAPREGAGRAKDPALFTPYSSLKETQTPPSDWIATGKDYIGTRGAPIMARPEDFHKRTLFGYTSDSTPTDRVIETLNGLEFENPVLQQGGQTFVDQEGRGFASEYVAMKTKQDAWNRAREAGADPLVTPLVMGPKSGDASQHLSQTMVQAIRANAANIDTSFVPKLPPKMAKDYAEIIDPSMGLLDPRLPSFLASRSGAERAAFVKAMDKSPAAKAGVPSAAAVRWATTDPQLMGAEMLSGGFRVFEPSSAPLMIDDPAGHATYNAIIGREGPNMTMGLQTRPWYLMFPDFAYDKMVASTPRGQNMLTMAAKPKDLRALQMNPNISQYIDQEWVDANSAYDEALRSKGKDAAYMAALDALVARAQRQGK